MRCYFAHDTGNSEMLFQFNKKNPTIQDWSELADLAENWNWNRSGPRGGSQSLTSGVELQVSQHVACA
ncbi:hypothetical protein V6N12_053118 [Hibiscus sabdariffa]|uniref:Uncharacterized protein n=1 Tax=Hibiscus sabdariffa TaxID=183260 RepID=A0ABR2D6L8_9ROSI